MTCVDAPADASGIFGWFKACGQVLTCVRPLHAAVTRRGPLWKSAGRVQHGYVRYERCSLFWFSRPRLLDRLPINLPRPVTSADGFYRRRDYAAATIGTR